jgi:hypothetical protein
MFARIARSYSRISAVLWFDVADSNFDWPLETSSASVDAIAAAIRGSAYAGTSFAHLSTSPIRPLR